MNQQTFHILFIFIFSVLLFTIKYSFSLTLKSETTLYCQSGNLSCRPKYIWLYPVFIRSLTYSYHFRYEQWVLRNFFSVRSYREGFYGISNLLSHKSISFGQKMTSCSILKNFKLIETVVCVDFSSLEYLQSSWLGTSSKCD